MGGDWKEMLYAAEQGDLELVKYHIQNGADPNYLHPEFLTTPLIESIRTGHLEIAEFLLENGANPAIKESFEGTTAMDLAVAARNKTAIRLLNKYPVNP